MAIVVDTDVLIVGGGPVGLFLGCLLARKGIKFSIVEEGKNPNSHSRSIGVHPPSLEMMSELGIADELIKRAISVESGVAYGNRRCLGTLSFKKCPGPYRFILSIPQYQTEAVLEKRLVSLAPAALRRGDRAIQMDEFHDCIIVGFESGKTIMARFVVGADGWNSTVRWLSGIGWSGKQYPDTYIMGDCKDDTELGPVACVCLARNGLVESFPLPGGYRRWVAKTPSFLEDPVAEELAELVASRTIFKLPVATSTMTSSFRTFSYTAEKMAKGRVLLAGDAAQVVSPIGGQGMNLGWMGARDIANVLALVLKNPESRERAFHGFDERRKRAGKIANRRAKFNMWMGRAHEATAAKHFFTWSLLHTPVRRYFANQFSMRGIDSNTAFVTARRNAESEE